MKKQNQCLSAKNNLLHTSYHQFTLRTAKGLPANGFTFVEVAVAVLLFGVIAATVTTFAAYYFRNYSFSYEQSQSIGIAQVALTRIVREIREARNGDDGSWPIVEANDTSFVFYSDVD